MDFDVFRLESYRLACWRGPSRPSARQMSSIVQFTVPFQNQGVQEHKELLDLAIICE
jgi:hypothetical protein